MSLYPVGRIRHRDTNDKLNFKEGVLQKERE
jgi:hypothetical protein